MRRAAPATLLLAAGLLSGLAACQHQTASDDDPMAEMQAEAAKLPADPAMPADPAEVTAAQPEDPALKPSPASHFPGSPLQAAPHLTGSRGSKEPGNGLSGLQKGSDRPPPQGDEAPFTLTGDLDRPEPFTSHVADGYLAMTVPAAPLDALRQSLAAALPYDLVARGPAHLDVLTPEEFKTLATRIPPARIEQIAQTATPSIQAARFTPVCLGHASADVAGRTEHAWYVVVDSDDLVALRSTLKDAFVKAGGDPSLFDPDLYFPHVTVGATGRDLFKEDGVIEDATSCVRPVANGA